MNMIDSFIWSHFDRNKFYDVGIEIEMSQTSKQMANLLPDYFGGEIEWEKPTPLHSIRAAIIAFLIK